MREAPQSDQTVAVEPVTDPDDPRLVDYRHLNDAAERAAAGRDSVGTGCAIVEGRVALETVVRSGLPLRSILLTPSRARVLAPLIDQVPVSVPRYVADRSVLRSIVGFDLHRGILASLDRRTPPDPGDLLTRCRRVVVTQALNDHENLGALFRNAAALGFDAVLLDDRTADPLYRRSIRVSSGWAATLPHARVGALPEGFATLRRAGFRVVALTPSAEAVPVDAAAANGLLEDPVALVVGAEGPGLTDDAVHGADSSVCVPMHPGVDSLNVATSFAVVAAFSAARHRR